MIYRKEKMKRLVAFRLAALSLAAAIIFAGSAAAAVNVFPMKCILSGSCFPNQVNMDFQVEYIAKGSGGGIKDLQNHSVNFA